MTETNHISSGNSNYDTDAAALATLISTLQGVSDETRTRLIQTVSTFFGLPGALNAEPQASNTNYVETVKSPQFSEDRTMSVKEFLLDKQPGTDIERVACLAYYLTHYRDVKQFKTIDISKLNTEGAQRKFSNAGGTVYNATLREYLLRTSNDQKQLGAVGEVLVEALPDREDARAAVAKIRQKKRVAKTKPKNTNS